MTGFAIYEVPAGGGLIGVSPVPGRGGDYGRDVARLIRWAPDLVLTLTTDAELERADAAGLPDDLDAIGIEMRHLSIPDFGLPPPEVIAAWAEIGPTARGTLGRGGRVLAQCYGGQGRSGMIALRLMVETGEAPTDALRRLRAVRPGVIETRAQQDWASAPATEQLRGG